MEPYIYSPRKPSWRAQSRLYVVQAVCVFEVFAMEAGEEGCSCTQHTVHSTHSTLYTQLYTACVADRVVYVKKSLGIHKELETAVRAGQLVWRQIRYVRRCAGSTNMPLGEMSTDA
jgi:hypothetical protein